MKLALSNLFQMEHIANVDVVTCRDLLKLPHCVWLDNFSHSYAAQMQGIANGAYDQCAWTGEAWRLFEPNRNMQSRYGTESLENVLKFAHNDDGQVFPACPDELFSEKTTSTVRKWMKNIDKKESLFDTSLAAVWEVDRVPLKPDYKKAIEKGKHVLAGQLKENRTGLKSLKPRRVVDINIASNRGLWTILRKFSDERSELKRTHYSILCADTNIFRRTLKVISYCFLSILFVLIEYKDIIHKLFMLLFFPIVSVI